MVKNDFAVSKVQNTTSNSSVEAENQTFSWETFSFLDEMDQSF